MFLYISLRLIQIFKFLITQWFFSGSSDDPPLGSSFLLYSLPLFYLSPPRVDQIANLLDTCPISTFLKFFIGSCKTESYCSGITSTLMRPGG